MSGYSGTPLPKKLGIKPGHRIRLEISSSNFPRFDRNLNTGGPIGHEGPTAAITAMKAMKAPKFSTSAPV